MSPNHHVDLVDGQPVLGSDGEFTIEVLYEGRDVGEEEPIGDHLIEGTVLHDGRADLVEVPSSKTMKTLRAAVDHEPEDFLRDESHVWSPEASQLDVLWHYEREEESGDSVDLPDGELSLRLHAKVSDEYGESHGTEYCENCECKEHREPL